MGGSSSTMSNNNSEMERMVNLFGGKKAKIDFFERFNKQDLKKNSLEEVLVQICGNKCDKYEWLWEMLNLKQVNNILDANIFYDMGTVKSGKFIKYYTGERWVYHRRKFNVIFDPYDYNNIFYNLRHFIDTITTSKVHMISFTIKDLDFHQRFGAAFKDKTLPTVDPIPDTVGEYETGYLKQVYKHDTDIVPLNYDEKTIGDLKAFMETNRMGKIYWFFGDFLTWGEYRKTIHEGERQITYNLIKNTAKDDVRETINKIANGTISDQFYILDVNLHTRSDECDNEFEKEYIKKKNEKGDDYFFHLCSKGTLLPYMRDTNPIKIVINSKNKYIYITSLLSVHKELSVKYLLRPLTSKGFQIIESSCDLLNDSFFDALCLEGKKQGTQAKWKDTIFGQKKLIGKDLHTWICLKSSSYIKKNFIRIVCNEVLFYYMRLKMLNPNLDDAQIYEYLGLTSDGKGVANLEQLFYMINNQHVNMIKNPEIARQIVERLKSEKEQLAGAIEYIEQTAGYY